MFINHSTTKYHAFLLCTQEHVYIALYHQLTKNLQQVDCVEFTKANQHLVQLAKKINSKNIPVSIVLAYSDYITIALEQAIDHIGDQDKAIPWLCVDYLTEAPEAYLFSQADSINPKQPRVYAVLKTRLFELYEQLGLSSNQVQRILFYDDCLIQYIATLNSITQPCDVLVSLANQIRLLQLDNNQLVSVANLPLMSVNPDANQIIKEQLISLCHSHYYSNHKNHKNHETIMLAPVNMTEEKIQQLNHDAVWKLNPVVLDQVEKLFTIVSSEQQHWLAALLGAGKYYYA